MWLRFWRPRKTKEASTIRLAGSTGFIGSTFWLSEVFIKGIFKRLLEEGLVEGLPKTGGWTVTHLTKA